MYKKLSLYSIIFISCLIPGRLSIADEIKDIIGLIRNLGISKYDIDDQGLRNVLQANPEISKRAVVIGTKIVEVATIKRHQDILSGRSVTPFLRDENVAVNALITAITTAPKESPLLKLLPTLVTAVKANYLVNQVFNEIPKAQILQSYIKARKKYNPNMAWYKVIEAYKDPNYGDMSSDIEKYGFLNLGIQSKLAKEIEHNDEAKFTAEYLFELYSKWGNPEEGKRLIKQELGEIRKEIAYSIQPSAKVEQEPKPQPPPQPGRLPQAGFRDGVLLKGSRPEVYVIQRGQKCWIPDPATFKAKGYDWNKIVVIPDEELERIPRGPEVRR